MMRFVYIHGFNSGPESRSGNELERLLDQPVHRVRMDYARPFGECLHSLDEQLQDFCPEASATADSIDTLCIMGSSLGGFFALQLRRMGIARVIAWNPVVFPALQLAQFLGENVRFTDGGEWIFAERALYSYGQADDGRLWANLRCRCRQRLAPIPQPFRAIILGDKDEVLDPALAKSFWGAPGYGIHLETIGAGHSIADYSGTIKYAQNDIEIWK